jgi:hypothetical protein
LIDVILLRRITQVLRSLPNPRVWIIQCKIHTIPILMHLMRFYFDK